MKTEVIGRDADGKPTKLAIDNGFCQYTKDFEPGDEWVDNQLNPSDFVACQIGADTRWLIQEVNRLRRENSILTAQLNRWQKASGF